MALRLIKQNIQNLLRFTHWVCCLICEASLFVVGMMGGELMQGD